MVPEVSFSPDSSIAVVLLQGQQSHRAALRTGSHQYWSLQQFVIINTLPKSQHHPEIQFEDESLIGKHTFLHAGFVTNSIEVRTDNEDIKCNVCPSM